MDHSRHAAEFSGAHAFMAGLLGSGHLLLHVRRFGVRFYLVMVKLAQPLRA